MEVLILVLMEDTLRDYQRTKLCQVLRRLNPCLMEDTLRVMKKSTLFKRLKVLILVLMEDTLRGSFVNTTGDYTSSLNPCFNGRYS